MYPANIRAPHCFSSHHSFTASSRIQCRVGHVPRYNAFIKGNGAKPPGNFTNTVTDDETLEVITETAALTDYCEAVRTLDEIGEDPDPADYGVWVPDITALIEKALIDYDGNAKIPDWLCGLIQNGIVASVGALLGFVLDRIWWMRSPGSSSR